MQKHDWNKIFDERPEEFHECVKSALAQLPEKEEINMKKSFGKKFAVVVAAVAAISVTAVGAGKVVSLSSGKNIHDSVDTVEKTEEQAKDAGININIVDKFDNGYTFKEGYVGDVDHWDDSGNKVATTKNLSATYVLGDASVYLDADQKNDESEYVDYVLEENYDGTDIYTYEWTNKFVPDDYEMTEQDKIDEAEGKVVFSYGSDEVEVNEIKTVKFVKDNTQVTLMDMDSNVDMGELVNMLKTVIDAQ